MELVPESGASPQEEASAAKPLPKLTEDDIAQLTREDCRRYLKEKGMRRPSWNKSQAIQQVIMLKALLETTADSDANYRKKLRIPRPYKFQDNNTVSEIAPRGTFGDANTSVLAEDAASHSRNDLDELENFRGLYASFVSANEGSSLTRTSVSTNMLVGQMTIFYSGKVNVYDDVPANKAQAVMHIASHSLQFLQDQADNGAVLVQSSSCHSKSADNKACPVDGPSNRKACVQRYLEKRKDRLRFKSKRRSGIASCTSLDAYFNHQMGNQVPNEPLVDSDTYSLPQITPHGLVNYEFVKSAYTSSGLYS